MKKKFISILIASALPVLFLTSCTDFLFSGLNGPSNETPSTSNTPIASPSSTTVPSPSTTSKTVPSPSTNPTVAPSTATTTNITPTTTTTTNVAPTTTTTTNVAPATSSQVVPTTASTNPTVAPGSSTNIVPTTTIPATPTTQPSSTIPTTTTTSDDDVQYDVFFYSVIDGEASSIALIKKIKVANNEIIEKPSDDEMAMTGYEFEGYYSNYTMTKEFDFNSNIKSSKNIYCKYSSIKKYNVLLDDLKNNVYKNDFNQTTDYIQGVSPSIYLDASSPTLIGVGNISFDGKEAIIDSNGRLSLVLGSGLNNKVGTYKICFDFELSNVSNQPLFSIQDINENFVFGILADENNILSISQSNLPNEPTTSGRLAANKKYSFYVEFDTSNETLNLYLDNKIIYSNDFRTNNSLGVISFYGGKTNIDDFAVNFEDSTQEVIDAREEAIDRVYTYMGSEEYLSLLVPNPTIKQSAIKELIADRMTTTTELINNCLSVKEIERLLNSWINFENAKKIVVTFEPYTAANTRADNSVKSYVIATTEGSGVDFGEVQFYDGNVSPERKFYDSSELVKEIPTNYIFKDDTTVYVLNILYNNELDIYINYSGRQGITYTGDSFENPIEGKTYYKGDLLPTWEYLQSSLKTKIYDATSYNVSSDNESYTAVENSNYMSETDITRKIDIFYNATGNINKAGKAGKLVDLKANLDKMPNFKEFLANNPTIEKAITVNGKIYYTPYFDSYNAIERMFIMDTNIVKLILDEDTDSNAKDTAIATTKTNGLQAYKYQPFMDATSNYATAPTVKVSKDAKASDITLVKTDNIIKKQNEAALTATGQSMRKQLRDYIKTVLGTNYGNGMMYENLSDFFIGEQACYNVDDLIALMRVVKASPELITGDANKEVEILVPRGAVANRVDNIADFLQVWGIQGFSAEYEMLYFDENGKLNDAASTPATYQALEYLSQIYDEGLILGDFYNTSTLGYTGYLNKYFGKTSDNGGYGFMLYDYSANVCSVNSKVNGIGTDDAVRTGSFRDTSVTGIMPVLPPLTYWSNKTTSTYDADIRDFSNKSLLRYSDDNRALKSTSWCIPASSDNIAGALKMLDYFMSEEGALINSFGPSQYWQGGIDSFTYAGEKTPYLSDETWEMFSNSRTDFWSFMRGYIGATHGIGHIRSNSINYQSMNYYGQIGQRNLENAIASGAVTLALVDNPIYANATNKAGFASSVPTAGYTKPGDAVANDYDAVTSFWYSDKYSGTASGWVKYIIDPAGTYTSTSTMIIGTTRISRINYSFKDVIDQIPARISSYLYTVANSQGVAFVPEYCKYI